MCSPAAQQITIDLVPRIRKTTKSLRLNLMPMYLDSGNDEVACDDCGNTTLVYEWITVDGDALMSRPWQCGCCIMKAYYADPENFEIACKA